MVRRLPPLNALRAFEAAARLGGFAKAADELAVTPAAVSHQVKGLEEYLGVSLFDRLPRALRLTDDGRRYLPELTKGFDQLARASGQITSTDLVRGRLTISTMPAFSFHWLVPRLPDFQRRYPDVSLSFYTTNRKIEFLRENVDMGIRYGLGAWPSLRSTFLMGEDVYPVAAPRLIDGAHPLREWQDLRRHQLLHAHTNLPVEPWIGWHPWLQQAGLADIDTERGLHFDNSELLVRAAIEGQGVAVGRSMLVGDAVREGLLVPLFGTRRPAEFSYYAVAPETTADHPKIRAFVEWLVEQARGFGS